MCKKCALLLCWLFLIRPTHINSWLFSSKKMHLALLYWYLFNRINCELSRVIPVFVAFTTKVFTLRPMLVFLFFCSEKKMTDILNVSKLKIDHTGVWILSHCLGLQIVSPPSTASHFNNKLLVIAIYYSPRNGIKSFQSFSSIFYFSINGTFIVAYQSVFISNENGSLVAKLTLCKRGFKERIILNW